ncbi:LacI family DNA-binding transcriptional regulator [Snuella sedimenti]|uniref:LacI family DNA-binding transcriptional regulator n=1 Tax=Snuella sedimenti TaxID=2798802 RepID=A0A8J7IUZ7_9FLAO|nr:LacI family DNA-binding transcriptional regulator [Snuella sedimenti]MBJ6368375.1 LacI family DNA-binding transcriptional regulator [Snuella sedimenti]
MDKKITIYDLAEALNVSPATVSRALNNHPSISFNTKKRIVSYAQSSGYRINKFAANLSKQKSNTIGVIVPKLNSPFMSDALSGIEKVANEHNYNLIISQSLESEQKEKLNAKTLYDSGVDALMVSLAYETTNYEHFEIFREQKIPLLFFDRVDYFPNCPTILIDNRQAGFDATEHLIQQGCKNILHVSGYLKRNAYNNRFNGFKDALYKHKLKFTPYNLYETDLDPKKVEFVMEHIKNSKEKFDGIFFANDAMAVACIQALLKEGVQIPKDIKIIGFNNNPVSEIIQPNLSTINYPGYELGVLAGQSIISHLKGNINIQSAESILLKHELIVRTSSISNK